MDEKNTLHMYTHQLPKVLQLWPSISDLLPHFLWHFLPMDIYTYSNDLFTISTYIWEFVYLGKSAQGQSNKGTSNLCIAFEWVQLNDPWVLPWNPPSNDKIDNEGVPGFWLNIQLCISSSLKSRPPLTLSIYLKYIILKEFSTEQLPQAYFFMKWK